MIVTFCRSCGFELQACKDAFGHSFRGSCHRDTYANDTSVVSMVSAECSECHVEDLDGSPNVPADMKGKIPKAYGPAPDLEQWRQLPRTQADEARDRERLRLAAARARTTNPIVYMWRWILWRLGVSEDPITRGIRDRG